MNKTIQNDDRKMETLFHLQTCDKQGIKHTYPPKKTIEEKWEEKIAQKNRLNALIDKWGPVLNKLKD